MEDFSLREDQCLLLISVWSFESFIDDYKADQHSQHAQTFLYQEIAWRWLFEWILLLLLTDDVRQKCEEKRTWHFSEVYSLFFVSMLRSGNLSRCTLPLHYRPYGRGSSNLPPWIKEWVGIENGWINDFLKRKICDLAETLLTFKSNRWPASPTPLPHPCAHPRNEQPGFCFVLVLYRPTTWRNWWRFP